MNLGLYPGKTKKLVLSPMKVLKVYCVDVKSDIGKALVVGWLVGWFVLKRILIFAQFEKTKLCGEPMRRLFLF